DARAAREPTVDEQERRPERGVLDLCRHDARFDAAESGALEGGAEHRAVREVQCEGAASDDAAEEPDVRVVCADEPAERRLGGGPGGSGDNAGGGAPHYDPRMAEADLELVEAATTLIDARTDDRYHTCGAAARTADGRIVTGVNVYHFTGGPCAELVVI